MASTLADRANGAIIGAADAEVEVYYDTDAEPELITSAGFA